MKFVYVVHTFHDDMTHTESSDITTFAYPKQVLDIDPQAYVKYYDIFQNKKEYEKDIIERKNNLEEFIHSFSFYSVIFYNTNEDNVPIFYLQTNKCNIPNLYNFYKNIISIKNNNSFEYTNWDPRFFHHISVPPRSRLYLFQFPDYKGKVMTFDNQSNAHIVYQVNMSVDDDISSLKWYSMFPIKDKYVLDKNEKLYRPFQIDDSYNLHNDMVSYDVDLNLPVFEMVSDPHHKNLINKLHHF